MKSIENAINPTTISATFGITGLGAASAEALIRSNLLIGYFAP